MKIELKEISVRNLVENYKNHNIDGVFGYDNKLNIRPKYQREFVYNDKQQKSVIETLRKDFPLNVMYWVKNDQNDDTYELLDGQQRTMSICEYIDGKFSINHQYFYNLENVEQEQILNYKLMIYFCEGNSKEKLDWFKTINIVGVTLTHQEIRNAIYTGKWLTDAKRYFSKPQCPAYDLSKDIMKGSPIRQDYLETVIDWISNKTIENYMSTHQQDTNAMELWLYFQSVINWTNTIFPNYRKEMKGVQFGLLYNEFKLLKLDANTIELEVIKLMQDEDVTKKSGIYNYVLSKNEKYLNIRAFSNRQKRESFERQNGVCSNCKKSFEITEMEADHINPWHSGGKTKSDNCQMLCKSCNRKKSGK